MNNARMEKAALRGEPSYVWRAGQERRLAMIQESAGDRCAKSILVDGCGVGSYLVHLSIGARFIVGIDIDFERCRESYHKVPVVSCGAGEHLPFQNDSFDLVLSHEVLEHVQDDRQTIREIVRVLRPGGRLVLFCPNRGYPFETHGIFWRGRYHFGNIPLVNYLPRRYRNRLAPHVNLYTRADLGNLFVNQPVSILNRSIIFGAYDNIIARSPRLGRLLRDALQILERTPLQIVGLSHFWIVEKIKS
jgi:SAM-dependent methyltransferase